IRNHRRHEKSRELEAPVAVGRAHHGNLDALIAQSGDTSGPFSFERGPPFQIEAELAKEIDRRVEVFDDDSDVVQPFDRHVSNLLREPGASIRISMRSTVALTLVRPRLAPTH